MFDLPLYETVLLLLSIGFYFLAGLWGLAKLLDLSEVSHWVLSVLVACGLLLEIMLLVDRGLKSGVFPLTGLFESLVLLTIVFGLLYVFLNSAIKRIWFTLSGICMLLAIILMAFLVAIPACSPQTIACKPWAIVHGIAMVFGLMLTAFSVISGFLYVTGKHKLDKKQVSMVLGKMPNLEVLDKMNQLGLQSGFVMLTFGLLIGFVMASITSILPEVNILGWLTDPKIILMEFLWAVLGVILTLKYFRAVKSRTVSCIVMGVFFIVLFALVSIGITGRTRHDFVQDHVSQSKETQ